jgi:hypothetical protein
MKKPICMQWLIIDQWMQSKLYWQSKLYDRMTGCFPIILILKSMLPTHKHVECPGEDHSCFFSIGIFFLHFTHPGPSYHHIIIRLPVSRSLKSFTTEISKTTWDVIDINSAATTTKCTKPSTPIHVWKFVQLPLTCRGF